MGENLPTDMEIYAAFPIKEMTTESDGATRSENSISWAKFEGAKWMREKVQSHTDQTLKDLIGELELDKKLSKECSESYKGKDHMACLGYAEHAQGLQRAVSLIKSKLNKD